MTEDSPALAVEGITIDYRGRTGPHRAVDGFSVSVATGEAVGLVGESGSGKSSVALGVLGLVPASGTVTIAGRGWLPRRGRVPREWRADAQMVFQDPGSSLDPRQSIGAGFGELRKLHGSRTDWITDAELMEAVGLEPSFVDRRSSQLSGGQIQRAVIARSVLLRPAVLLADEPTSSLDVSVQAQILELLSDIRSRFGIAMLFISHDLSVVRHVCSRVLVMRHGVVVESGTAASVLDHPSHEYTKALVASVPGRRHRGITT